MVTKLLNIGRYIAYPIIIILLFINIVWGALALAPNIEFPKALIAIDILAVCYWLIVPRSNHG